MKIYSSSQIPKNTSGIRESKDSFSLSHLSSKTISLKEAIKSCNGNQLLIQAVKRHATKGGLVSLSDLRMIFRTIGM